MICFLVPSGWCGTKIDLIQNKYNNIFILNIPYTDHSCFFELSNFLNKMNYNHIIQI